MDLNRCLHPRLLSKLESKLRRGRVGGGVEHTKRHVKVSDTITVIIPEISVSIYKSKKVES